MVKRVNPDLSVRIGKIRLSNPVMVASGTFGYAEEFKDLVNLKKLGAIVTKSITLKPTKGNPPPRICETPSGMLNAIGLQNDGAEDFLKSKLPFLKRVGVPIIVSIAGRGKDEFVELVKRLDKVGIDGLELNISCPNIGAGQLFVAQDEKAAYNVVKAVRKVTRSTLITKLSPNVTDIVPIAKAAVRAGTDALALVNTFTGMSIDIETRTPRLGNITGGLSGPAIKPIAIRMVWEVAREVDAPIIGMGGIMNAEDALEFIIAGATAVAVGTANLVNPKASVEIIEGIKEYIVKNNIKKISNLTGTLKI
jgi:dihydroorotate dehydrogenase (NAD+) catalytic subunit